MDIRIALPEGIGITSRMRGYSRFVELLVAALLAVSAAPIGTASTGTKIEFSSLDGHHPRKLSGTLYMPEGRASPCPAVVVVHGTTGIDSRQAFYRDPILKAGIAILEVDFKTGIYTGPFNRPSPDAFLPMGFAALKELRKWPAIDPGRIGIMGFSLGGHLTVTTAFEANRKTWMNDEKGFAAHAALYPVCKPFLKQDNWKMTGAPMIIFYGTEDAYGEGKNVPEFKRLLLQKSNFEVTTVEYAGAHHGFDRNEPAMSYRDPAAIGWKGYVAWDGYAAKDAQARVVDFLQKTLATK